MKKIEIGGHRIGEGEPCFVIAEAGSNHDGSLKQALQLIDAASDAGADAVKFQTFRARTLYPNSDARPKYLKALGVRKTIYELIREMEMPFEWLPALAARCRDKRILFLSTPFDEECADRIDPYVAAYKIASYELTHVPLLRHVARKGKPVIVSTGAADVPEIDRATREIRTAPLCLMQCTAKYPAPPESMNLNAIPFLKRRYRVPVGLSDHSAHPWIAPVAAVGLGANLLEKHFTLSRKLRGPDHSYAVEPDELREMVREVRQASVMLGDGRKTPHAVERELREYRRGIFALRPIGRGERFSAENIAVLRRAGKPASGLGPERFPKLMGKTARRSIPAHRLLSLHDV